MFVYFMYGCYSACMYNIHVPGSLGSQKMASDSLELGLLKAVSCQVGAESPALDF